MSEFTGKLYVVATPIGNLEDITLRAVRILKEVDLIAAEDTRHSGHLLTHFEIRKPIVSYHQFNEAKRVGEFHERFRRGETIALISDAGMPGVSDPGERLIRQCVEAGVPVEVIPGPSAVLLALVGAGFSMARFYFGGFLPVKSAGRRRELAAARQRSCTTVYYESPHRLLRALEDADAEMPHGQVCVARELTKKFEEWKRGRPSELLAHFAKTTVRGEICLVIAPEDAKASKKKGIPIEAEPPDEEGEVGDGEPEGSDYQQWEI